MKKQLMLTIGAVALAGAALAEEVNLKTLAAKDGSGNLVVYSNCSEVWATGREADKAFDTYGVDAVMIGRATFGCPWIFSRENLDFNAKLDILEELLRINVERIDEKRGILHTRRHLAATPIFKGIPDFRQTRIAMLRAETMPDLLTILEDVRKRLG